MQELIILFLIAFTVLSTLLLKSSFSYDNDSKNYKSKLTKEIGDRL